MSMEDVAIAGMECPPKVQLLKAWTTTPSQLEVGGFFKRWGLVGSLGHCRQATKGYCGKTVFFFPSASHTPHGEQLCSALFYST
jgi:hypothetical protein